jgi:hypothetical protein
MSPRLNANLTLAAQARCLVIASKAPGKVDRATSFRARLRSHAVSPSSIPPTMRRPHTTLRRRVGRRPQAPTRRHCLMLSLAMPKMVSEAVTSGASSAL